MRPLIVRGRAFLWQRFPTFHFSTSEKLFRNFEQTFTPRGWLRSASNFGKTRFRWSPTFDFSTPKNFFRQKFLPEKFFVNTPKRVSAKCPFWRSCAGLDVTIRCASKIHCQTYRFQPSTTLGGGVKRKTIAFFSRVLGKKTYTFFAPMMIWYYDTMILWYYGTMILWYYDTRDNTFLDATISTHRLRTNAH